MEKCADCKDLDRSFESESKWREGSITRGFLENDSCSPTRATAISDADGRRRSIQILCIPSFSFVSCPMSDGASENDDRLSPEFAPRSQPPPLRHFRPLQLFSSDWNSRHAAFKKSLIGVPSSLDRITSSHARGGSRPPVMRFPGTQLGSGTDSIKRIPRQTFSFRFFNMDRVSRIAVPL